jgi:uncharacterized protein (DUF58 family)
MAQLPLLLLMLLGLAILLRIDLIYYLVYVLGGVYLLSRAWTALGVRALTVHHHFTRRIFAGETSHVQIVIENHSRLPVPWLRYDERAEPALGAGAVSEALALASRARITLEYAVEGRRRGIYAVGPGRLSIGDLFGFAEVAAQPIGPERLIVYPRVVGLRGIALTSRAPYGVIHSRSPLFADPLHVVGLREYRPGDPLRSIDWKSSARTGGLQVKKIAPAVSLPTIILVDLHSAAYSRQLRGPASEWAIVVAASLANHLQGERQAVGLGSNGCDTLEGRDCWVIPARTGAAHLMTLLEWLARVQLAETRPLVEWLPEAAKGLTWGATVLAVAPTGDAALCSALGRLRQAGLNPVLVAVEPHAQFELVEARARQAGVAAYRVADEADLRRWQARNAARAPFRGGA